MAFFLIEYATSGAGLRSRGDAYEAAQAARKAYRTGLGRRVLLAGPKFENPDEEAISSVVILEAASGAEARQIASEDPYYKMGEFREFTVNEMRITVFNSDFRLPR